jgi:hypothetical protein
MSKSSGGCLTPSQLFYGSILLLVYQRQPAQAPCGCPRKLMACDQNVTSGAGNTAPQLKRLLDLNAVRNAKPTVYISSAGTYIFTKDGVHLIKQEPHFGTGWASQTCLVDADMNHGLPENTMIRSELFVMSASSPRLDRHRRVKQRTFSQEFVLNPPSRVSTVTRSSSRSSHCSVSLI